MGLETLFIAGSLISTGLGIYGQRKQASAANKVGNQNAAQVKETARQNQQLAEMEAKNIEVENQQQVLRKNEVGQSNLATMRARMGSSGVSLSTGSNLEIMGISAGRMATEYADMSREASIKAARFRYDGAREVYEAGIQAKNIKTNAKNTAKAAKMGALTTGITGITNTFVDNATNKANGIYK